MKCPSCHYDNITPVNYCGRCRMSFTPLSLAVARWKEHLYWILRRACAGSTSGFIAWFFIPVVSRILSQTGSHFLIFGLTGFMGGAFLGAVDGMVEESTPKTIRGAIVGGLGGLLGGMVFQVFRNLVDPQYILWLIFLYWAIAGAFIGTVSAWWEQKREKILCGAVSGFFGGGIGAYIGSSFHAYLVQEIPTGTWLFQRFTEALLGGIIGIALWSAIAAAERFFIFQRRTIDKQNHKTCDRCHAKNELASWYCTSCGSVLQESAPPEKLNLSPFSTLQQVSAMLRFLSRLSAATGFIAGFVSLFVFIPNYAGMEQLVTIIVIVVIALLSYALQILFSSLSETIKVYISK
ncbi:MAG TPA: hypothetical protein PK876_10420 [Elusimicrobiota bacterium]|nr:hypothetical protein [Elusimicrobiota bacterium]